MEFRVTTTVLVRTETIAASLGDDQPFDEDPAKFRVSRVSFISGDYLKYHVWTRINFDDLSTKEKKHF
ncbi:hypothetical protein Hdeb2414_s0016g00495031 [Helianthus debilis subsp. tardiflorus]